MNIKTLRGMNDLLPEVIGLWQEVETQARSLFSRYGYQEIRTPVLEEMVLFTRSVGEATNIVEKEMYVFQDKGEDWVALRPEGTASVVRAYVEHHYPQNNPSARFFYMGPMYRYERPQKGRYRQFYQLGAEAFGSASPHLDAECIHMVDVFFKQLGLKNYQVEINSLGCPQCRVHFQGAFLDYLLKNQEKLCFDCKRRMERNPLRVLDCKEASCRAVTDSGPQIADYWCESCRNDFQVVKSTLDLLKTPYHVNPKIVRGLDYYLKTTFEVTTTSLGSQNAIAGGGRYDGLVKQLGGPETPAFGFAMGLERLIEVLKLDRGDVESDKKREGVFIALLTAEAKVIGIPLVDQLRGLGYRVDWDFDLKSVKSQMRRADKMNARHVILIGEDEMKAKKVSIRDLEASTQLDVEFNNIVSFLASC